jgi:hypothetical protein
VFSQSGRRVKESRAPHRSEDRLEPQSRTTCFAKYSNWEAVNETLYILCNIDAWPKSKENARLADGPGVSDTELGDRRGTEAGMLAVRTRQRKVGKPIQKWC